MGVGHSLGHREYTGEHKVKENWLSSAKMPSTEITSQLGIGTSQLPFFIPEVSLFWFCVGDHSFWESMSTAVLTCPKYIVLLWSSPICVSQNLSASSSVMVSELLPFVTDNSIDAFSLHFDQLRVSVSHKETLLMKSNICTIVYICIYIFREQFHTMLF